MKKTPEDKELTDIVLGLIEERRPKNVKQLAGMVKEKVNLGETEIIDLLLKLEFNGLIRFQDTSHTISASTYLKSHRARWFWLTVAIELFTLGSVFVLPNVYPFVLARNLFGAIFLLVLPGYVFIRFLFPIAKPRTTSEGEIEMLQRGVLSLGASFALVSIIGLLLYYAGGLDLLIIVLSLSVITFLFALGALIREYSC